MSKYGAVFTCGHCKKKTDMSDEAVESLVNKLGDPTMPMCVCENFSFASSFTARFRLEGWTAWSKGEMSE